MSKLDTGDDLRAFDCVSDHQTTQRSLGLKVEAIAENIAENLEIRFADDDERCANDVV